MPSNRLGFVDKVYLVCNRGEYTVIPLGNYITLELIEDPSPIIIIGKDDSPKGKITGISPKVKTDLKIGDVVYYRAKSGHEYQGQHFVKHDEIMGKV